MKIDLSSNPGKHIVREFMKNKFVAHMHWAVPCGTATKSRERPMPKHLLAQGCPQPRQLRSSLFPRGLQGLSEHENMKIELANSIYDFCAEVIETHGDRVLWTVENPDTSYVWVLPGFVRILALPSTSQAKFHQCMHGGRRPVVRRWVSNFKSITLLNAVCDESHELPHGPFGAVKIDNKWSFKTADEAAYPRPLCQKAARIIVEELIAKGYQAVPLSLDEVDSAPAFKRPRVKALKGGFTRGNRLPPLVSECKEVKPAFVENPQIGKVLEIQNLGICKVLRLVVLGDAGAITYACTIVEHCKSTRG